MNGRTKDAASDEKIYALLLKLSRQAEQIRRDVAAVRTEVKNGQDG